MLPYQQSYVWLDLLKKTAADSIHRLVEQNIWLIVSDLHRQDIVEPTLIFDSGNPWHETSSQTKPPSPVLAPPKPMLPRPGLLHIFVVHIDVIRFMTEFLQVVRVKEWPSKEALDTHPHLFGIRPFFQPPVLSIEPA